MGTGETKTTLAAVVIALVLAGCAKNRLPPPPFPVPPSPPASPSIPTTLPSPTPSPPSRPSQPSQQPSPPNPDSSQQDAQQGEPSPSPPQVALPSPRLPGPKGDRQEQPGSKQERGEKGSSSGTPDGAPNGDEDRVAENAKERRKVGEDLQKAGDDIADASLDEPYDPLDHSSPENPGKGPEGKSGDEFEDPLLAENDVPGNPTSDPNADPRPDVSEIMEEVADAVRKAGIEVAAATNEEELRAAEEALARAQVQIIVAESDLEALREAGIDVDRQSESLANAERQIIVASRVVLASRSDLPELANGGESPPDELDIALEDSLIIFDDEMADVRRAGRGGPAPEGPTVASLPTRMPESETEEINGVVPEMAPGELPEAEDQLIAAVNVPDDVGDGQDDDIIARQLREAAIAEADPELREKLWEEYRRYKQGTR